MIFDKSKYSSFLAAPFGLFASAIVIPFVPFTDPNPNPQFTFHFVFYGTDKAELYFFMHWMLLIFSGLALQNYSLKNVNAKKVWIDVQLLVLAFFSYVILISYTFNIDKYTTGISKKDWELGGSFFAISKMLHTDNSYLAAIPFYLFAYLVINSIWYIKFLKANQIPKNFYFTLEKLKNNLWKKVKNKTTDLD